MRSKQNQVKQKSKKSRSQSSQFGFDDDNFRTPRPKSQRSKGGFDFSRNVMSTTLKNHPNQCLCKDCLCGRHLCKFSSPAPSMSLASTYKLHYPPRTPYRHKQAQRPASAKVPESPLLSARSTYLDDYPQRNGDPLERPKPEDLLKCKPGISDLTSYQQEFPGHRGKNQYVPMNPELFQGGLDFIGASNYSKEFGPRGGQSAEKAKPPDQFRMNGSWLGESSYKDQFQNPKNHVSKDKNKKLSQSQVLTKSQVSSASQKNPSSHFKTTYGGDYRANKGAICPAALKAREIEQSLTKNSFKQNTNFKGIDSKYTSLAKYGSQF